MWPYGLKIWASETFGDSWGKRIQGKMPLWRGCVCLFLYPRHNSGCPRNSNIKEVLPIDPKGNSNRSKAFDYSESIASVVFCRGAGFLDYIFSSSTRIISQVFSFFSIHWSAIAGNHSFSVFFSSWSPSIQSTIPE